MRAEAIKHIMRHEVEDTFYMIDLGNVTRMFKVMRCMCMRAGRSRGGGLPMCVSLCTAGHHHSSLAHASARELNVWPSPCLSPGSVGQRPLAGATAPTASGAPACLPAWRALHH